MPKKPRQTPHDRVWTDYTEQFREHVLPTLVQSSYMISIGERVDLSTLDLRSATEMGLMLLLDKPLLVVVPPGIQISAALRRAATVVLDDFDVGDPAAQDRLAEVFRTLTEGDPDA